MLRAIALLAVIEVLVACSTTHGPGIPGGGGGSGAPLPVSDSGTEQGDADTPLLACLAITAAGLNNTIAIDSSFDPLSFSLTYVYAEWDCDAAEPGIRLGMSDSGCSFGSGQRLVMHIPILPNNADGTSIAESAEYVRPFSPAGRCGFAEGTFVFDIVFLNPYRFKAEFILRSLFDLCDQDLEFNPVTITGAFDIDLGHSYSEACES